MRIAHVSHSFDCGGSMAVMATLCSELARRGHRVDAVCLDRRSRTDHERLWTNLLRAQGVGVFFLGREQGSAGVAAMARLWWLAQHQHYDVMHSHLPMPDAISGVVRRCSMPPFVHVITVHNTYEPRSRTLAWLAAGAHVVYCSEAARRSNPLAGLSQTVIPNGILQPNYATLAGARKETRQQLGLTLEGRVIIAVGRLCPQKAMDTALEAIALLKHSGRVPGLQLLVCGDGEERRQLEFQAHELGLGNTVHFLGIRADIPQLLSACDAFISTSRHEGMPLSVLEALSAGLPCVLSAIPEHYELAARMPGCLFASNAPAAMSSALESALLQPVTPAELRECRAELLRKHSVAQAAESYLALYERCCQPRFQCQSQYP